MFVLLILFMMVGAQIAIISAATMAMGNAPAAMLAHTS
jgi:hypothetical protein